MQYFRDLFGPLTSQTSPTSHHLRGDKRDRLFGTTHSSSMATGDAAMYTSSASELRMPNGNTTSISIQNAVYDVLKQSNCFTEIIKIKFDCEAILIDSPLNTQPSPVRAEKVYENTLGQRRRVTVSVWMDDLTQHRVDAVVNAANEDLKHLGGLALSLASAGGYQFERESKRIIDERGKIQTGDVAVTTGGNLPCKCVIHAVGPDCNAQFSVHVHTKCRDLLKRTIKSILETVRNRSLESVAIPAVSSGIFGFPLEECAAIIVKTLKELCESDGLGSSLKEIRLVNHDEKTVSAMKKACEGIIGSSGSSYFLGRSSTSLSSQSPDSITVNTVSVQIKTGCIEEQKTAAIVNSASEQLDLSEGVISRAILRKAGYEMQREIYSRPRSQVMKTNGHRLSCDSVYHVIVPVHASPSEKAEVLRRVVSKCLENAITDRFDSISFPAVGTGIINIEKRQVANIMISEVIRFAKLHPGKELRVFFVIYPQDQTTFEAFQNELRAQRAKQNSSPNSSPDYQRSAANDSGSFSSFRDKLEPMKPTIHLGGKNITDVEEAEAWIENTLQQHNDCLLIENNHIIFFGAKEHDSLIRKLDSSVEIIENLKNASAHIEVRGPGPDVIKAVLEIEKLLCDVQKQYELKQKEELMQLAGLLNEEKRDRVTFSDVCELKTTIDTSTQQFKDKLNEFAKVGLHLVKMEKIVNPLLKITYQSKKDAIEEKRKTNVTCTMYHQVPAQFYNLVCKIGFQRIYSQPEEPKYGAGIYFIKSLKRLHGNYKEKPISDKYIYIFQAEVITGKTTKGKESYIVPPPVGSDYMDLYDSVSDYVITPETYVIFNSSQALPQYLFTCKGKSSVSEL